MKGKNKVRGNEISIFLLLISTYQIRLTVYSDKTLQS